MELCIIKLRQGRPPRTPYFCIFQCLWTSMVHENVSAIILFSADSSEWSIEFPENSLQWLFSMCNRAVPVARILSRHCNFLSFVNNCLRRLNYRRWSPDNLRLRILLLRALCFWQKLLWNFWHFFLGRVINASYNRSSDGQWCNVCHLTTSIIW